MHDVQLPKITVIMPAYNTGKYIRESIESVIGQSVDFWELLIVDDGSSDGTIGIADEYAKKYSDKIYLYSHPESANKGASASRNLALKHAKGEYIAFLDSDDVWLPSNLEVYYNVIKDRNEIDMVYGGTQWWYSWNEYSLDQKIDEVLTITTSEVIFKPPVLIPKTLLNGEIYMPCMCSLLVRTKAILSVGGFEAEFTRVFTDQVFYTKIFLHFNVVAIPGHYARYRQHDQSSCKLVEAEGKLLNARENYLNWARNYLIEKDCVDQDVWNSLNRALNGFSLFGRFKRKVKRLLNFPWKQRLGA